RRARRRGLVDGDGLGRGRPRQRGDHPRTQDGGHEETAAGGVHGSPRHGCVEGRMAWLSISPRTWSLPTVLVSAASTMRNTAWSVAESVVLFLMLSRQLSVACQHTALVSGVIQAFQRVSISRMATTLASASASEPTGRLSATIQCSVEPMVKA